MNIGEFAKYLDSLPDDYKALPADKMGTMFWHGEVYVFHPSAPPVVYTSDKRAGGGKWEVLPPCVPK